MAKNLAQQRREEIIRAAHKCFITRGFHATGPILLGNLG